MGVHIPGYDFDYHVNLVNISTSIILQICTYLENGIKKELWFHDEEGTSMEWSEGILLAPSSGMDKDF